MLDRIGAKRPVVLGCALACVGFFLWASRVTELSESLVVWSIVLAGAELELERETEAKARQVTPRDRAARLTRNRSGGQVASGGSQVARTSARSVPAR